MDLTREEERKLIRKYRGGDLFAAERLLQSFEYAIKKWANYYWRIARHNEFDDYMQAGRIGFLRGLNVYDLRRKTRLSTIADGYIRGAIQREMQKGVIYVPKQNVGNYEATKEKARLAKYTFTDAALGAAEARCDEDGVDLKAVYQEASRCLTPRERNILRRRMDGMTLKQIGDEMGLTRERIRQIETKAIRRVRRYTEANNLLAPPAV